MQKRLGDGFYEQRLLREQVAQLTGRRFLDGYANDEVQYRALMDAGMTYAQAWNLVPGVALTAAQMAALTSDMVWLVAQAVSLPDGSRQTALVPQLYVRVQPGDVDGSGSLLAGQRVNLNLGGDLVNSGSIAGRTLVQLNAANIDNLGGRISGNDVALAAQQDIANIGGTVDATNSLIASAGRDIEVVSTTRDSENLIGQSSFTRTAVERVAGLYVSGPAGVLVASAGRDITLTGAVVANSGAGGQTLIDAGNDLVLGSVATSRQDNVVWDAKNHLNQGSTRDVGSVIQTQGDVTLQAGNDLSARAAQVSSTAGAIDASAGRDVNITAGEASQNWSEARQRTSSGLLSSTTVTNLDETRDTRALAASFSGDSVNLNAAQNLKLTGSNVVSDSGTQLTAGQDVAIEAATDTHSETHYADKLKSGLFTSGASITLGMRQQTTDQQGQSTSAAASTVGSTGGNVAIQADNHYRQTGSDVLAPQGDIAIQAQSVDIVAAEAHSRNEQTTEFKQAGLTLAVSSPVISAIQTVQQMQDAASRTSDGRMQALAAGTAALSAKNAADAIRAGQGTTINGIPNQMPVTNDQGEVIGSRDATAAEQAGGASVSISIGASQSQSNSVQTATSAQSSTVAAGGNIDIRATGGGAASDLTVQGSTIRAGNDVSLSADDEINLLAAKNTFDQHSKNSSASASIGISLGSQTGITVAASGSRGHADGSDVSYSNTHVEAGNQLTMQSGSDTTLRGAVASGNQVVANVGGNLAIESLQDTSQYDSRQQSLGGSITFGPAPGASISASQSRINSDYASVTEQSGIRAGDGGFQVNVAGNTDLAGGAITSTQAAIDQDANRFHTGGTLTTSDIQNRARYNANAAGINLGSGVSQNGQLAPQGTSAGFGHDSGNASSTTQAAISGIAGNSAARTGDAQNGIGPIFDAERVQQEIDAQTQITQAFGREAPRAVASVAQQQASDLRAQARAAAEAGNLERAQQLEAEARRWDEGGTYRVILHAAVGGLAGGAPGALGAGTVASAAPLLDDLQYTVQSALTEAGANEAVAQLAGQLVAQTTAAGLGAAASGGSPAGAAMGLDVDANNRQLHWNTFTKKREECRGSNSKECQTINRMAGGGQSPVIDFLALPEADVAVNFDAAGKVVSYTLLDKTTHQPMMIMELAEFVAYREAPLATRGWYQLAPQWSLDLGSAATYAAIGNTDKAQENLGYALTSPEYWFTVGTGAAGGVLARGGLLAREGVGANSAKVIEGAIPNAENAAIDPSKLISYALNPEHSIGGNKAIVFEAALGYNQSNADQLIAQIQQGVRSNPAILGKADQFGQRFTVDMPITGPNGNTVTVRTGWILDPGSTTPRLTTTYVK